MLRDFTWTEKYEEAMLDEHPRYANLLKNVRGFGNKIKNLFILNRKTFEKFQPVF